jgi:Fe2+ or Zn2+ uptake regulation protein
MTAHPELTRNQTLVLRTLGKSEAPLSDYSILDRLRDEGLALAWARLPVAFGVLDGNDAAG